jgi:hypothetical protein
MRQCQPYATGDLLLKLQAFDQKHPGTETVLCFRVFLHQFIFFSQKNPYAGTFTPAASISCPVIRSL